MADRHTCRCALARPRPGHVEEARVCRRQRRFRKRSQLRVLGIPNWSRRVAPVAKLTAQQVEMGSTYKDYACAATNELHANSDRCTTSAHEVSSEAKQDGLGSMYYSAVHEFLLPNL